MKKIKKHLVIWFLLTKNSFVTILYAKLALLIFLSGKIIRFLFFFAFLYFLMTGTKTLAGYTTNQVLFFFLTFNLVDITGQLLFREVYRFRPQVVSGNFDLVLVKPVSALFRSLTGGTDLIDLLTIPPIIFFVVTIGATFSPNLLEIILYILLMINGLLIVTAFHIAVLALGIITLEVDHVVMIYRDLVSLGRIPIDVYKEPLKGILTYIVPVAIMITLPAKVLMGLVSWQGVLVSLVIGITVFWLALKFWQFALRFYTSASS